MEARPDIVGRMYTAMMRGMVMRVAFGMTCGFLSSPATVDMDS